MEQGKATRSGLRYDDRLGALSRHAELLILCARIGFNPPA